MPNAEQRQFWNDQAGLVWVQAQERMDPQIRAHGAAALDALALARGERVIDVGCGCGDTTLALAERVGPEGRVLGVDISAPMLARARERAKALEHVTLVEADAQTHPFEAGQFDAIFSRFGVMFFDAPSVAFANLKRALTPKGRVAFACWRPAADNQWAMVPMSVMRSILPMPAPAAPGAPGPFAFADPSHTRRALEAFGDVQITPVDLPMRFGPPDEAARFLTEMGPGARALREVGADEATRARVVQALREQLAAYVEHDSVTLGSSIWVVRAR